MPIHRVVVDKSAERAFVRRALKKMPLEYIEGLWGYVDKAGTAHICCFIPIDHTATPTELHYEDEAQEDCYEEAKHHSMVMLGSIHTHPFRDETLFSEADLRESLPLEDRIQGICAIEVVPGKRRKTRIAYWPCIRPIPLDYTNWSKP